MLEGSKSLRCEQLVKRPFECNLCEKTFAFQDNLTKHKRVHTKETHVACSQCGKMLSSSGALKRHTVVIHSKQRLFSCDVCAKTFQFKQHVQKHQYTHTKENLFACPICDKKFACREYLPEHRRLVHSGERKFCCEICNKKFGRSKDFKIHMHIHNGVKPHKCDQCNYASAYRSSMTMHKRTHSQIKPYTCKECNASFSTQSRWKSHCRIHSGEKLHKCSHCGHRFTRHDSLRIHENMHETQKNLPIACNMQDFGTQLWTDGNGCRCTIRTKTQLDMDYHIQRNHTMEGLGKKLQSETRLADFFRSKAQDFDRDWVNQINFKYCKNIEGNACSARPDFFLPSQSIRLKCILLIGNDEFAHRRYPCDFQRIFNIANALEQNPDFQGLPLLYIRFNPHFFKRDGIYFDPPLSSSHEKLLQLIESLNPFDIKPGVNLIYMNYDTTNNQLDIFNEDPENDFAKLYQSCVIKHM